MLTDKTTPRAAISCLRNSRRFQLKGTSVRPIGTIVKSDSKLFIDILISEDLIHFVAEKPFDLEPKYVWSPHAFRNAACCRSSGVVLSAVLESPWGASNPCEPLDGPYPGLYR
jgi:hypothetical protein